MSIGMAAALVWAAFQGWVLGRGYPYNTFLFIPEYRFNDFSDMTLIASQPNPYGDPIAVYLPFAYLCLRPLYSIPDAVSIAVCFFVSLTALFLLLDRVLRPIVAKPYERMFLSLLFLVTSYPVLACFDRGNIEIIVVALSAGSIYLISKSKYILAVLWLIPAISFKLYPAGFLLLFLRQRKIGVILAALAAFIILSLGSLNLLSYPLKTACEFYTRNLVFHLHNFIYSNFPLEDCASPWNAYKIFLVTGTELGLLHPVNFSQDGDFIKASYFVYSIIMGLVAACIAIYSCLLEKQFVRSVIAILLMFAISTPSGNDYKLLYACMALVMLIALPTRRNNDLVAVVLLALTMVPKKEIILPYAGITETGFHDVSIQVLLDPLLVLAALFLLLCDSRKYFDFRWTQVRLTRLAWAIFPFRRLKHSSDS